MKNIVKQSYIIDDSIAKVVIKVCGKLLKVFQLHTTLPIA